MKNLIRLAVIMLSMLLGGSPAALKAQAGTAIAVNPSGKLSYINVNAFGSLLTAGLATVNTTAQSGVAVAVNPSGTLSYLNVDANGGLIISGITNGTSGSLVLGTPGYTDTGYALGQLTVSSAAQTNTYAQFSIQGLNPGTIASTDFTATADNGTMTTHYVDLGINSSGNNSGTYPTGANACFLTTSTSADPLYVGTGAAANLTLFTNNTPAATIGTDQNVSLPASAVTAGSGTGFTVNQTGAIRQMVYKSTVTYAGFSAGAKTADVTVATLPAKCQLLEIIVDVTTPFKGGGETASTMTVGITAGGNTLVVSFNTFAAAITKGLADADLGTAMTRSTAVQGGYIPSWAGTTPVSSRLTTTTNNTSSLTQGVVTYYLVTEIFP